MTKLVTYPTQTAQWQSLVADAQKACAQLLDENLESYLVFLLMRFLEKPEIANSVLGLEFLESLQQPAHEKLRDVGDKCLLFSGLFPQHAERRRVKISYFVNIGQSAYANLSTLLQENAPGLYSNLSEGFVTMMDVLQSMGSLANEQQYLALLQAAELYRDTGSQRALDILRRRTNGIPMFDMDEDIRH